MKHEEIGAVAGVACDASDAFEARIAFPIGIGHLDARPIVASSLAGIIDPVVFPLAETGERLSTPAILELAARMIVGLAIGALFALRSPTPRFNASSIRSEASVSKPI